MFSESSTGSWAELQLPCCLSKKGELPENMLQNLFLNLPPQTVLYTHSPSTQNGQQIPKDSMKHSQQLVRHAPQASQSQSQSQPSPMAQNVQSTCGQYGQQSPPPPPLPITSPLAAASSSFDFGCSVTTTEASSFFDPFVISSELF